MFWLSTTYFIPSAPDMHGRYQIKMAAFRDYSRGAAGVEFAQSWKEYRNFLTGYEGARRCMPVFVSS